VMAAAAGHATLARQMPDGPAYNVSTGSETSVASLARLIADAAGIAPTVERAPARGGDIERSALAPGKAAAALGWSAATPLEAGLLPTWRWFAGSGRT
jgi:UDP-glucose 4-epimerase